MASSADNHQVSPAPPPTPSNQHHHPEGAPDALSRLLLRLPPALGLPTRRRAAQAPTTADALVVSLSGDPSLLLPQPGFFQLAREDISAQLAESAELEAESILRRTENPASFPWPQGHDDEEDDYGASFCFEPTAPESSSFPTCLRELAVALERAGQEVVEALSYAAGFNNPFKEQSRVCRLLWLSKGGSGGEVAAACYPGRLYPYVVCLQYQVRKRKYSLLSDSGWVSVVPGANSVLVTVGDVAQVWSNGKLKKVRGRPLVTSGEESDSSFVSIALLLTLPLESALSPLPLLADGGEGNGNEEEEDGVNGGNKFSTFSFEEYAWRVYHERLSLKDPLDRYRI